MKCKKVKKLLSYQIDGKINSKDLESIKKHLSICPHCNKERERLLAYKDLIKKNFSNITPPLLSPHFDQIFHQRLDEQKTPLQTVKEKLLFPYKRIFTEALAVAAVGVLIFLLVIPKKRVIEKENIPDTTLCILAESDLNGLIETAVIKTKDVELKNLVDLQAKEILQNFL